MRKGLLALSILLVFAAFTIVGCNKAARTTTETRPTTTKSGAPTTAQEAPTAPSTTTPTSPSTK
ncbi:MAG: hypothetical protein M1376_13905 [Planctomycetes bacterium]|nr:hypothetical protein [Planctomycetota bacterium]